MPAVDDRRALHVAVRARVVAGMEVIDAGGGPRPRAARVVLFRRRQFVAQPGGQRREPGSRAGSGQHDRDDSGPVGGQVEALGQIPVDPDDLAAARVAAAEQYGTEFPGARRRLCHRRPDHLADRGDQQAEDQAKQRGERSV